MKFRRGSRVCRPKARPNRAENGTDAGGGQAKFQAKCNRAKYSSEKGTDRFAAGDNGWMVRPVESSENTNYEKAGERPDDGPKDILHGLTSLPSQVEPPFETTFTTHYQTVSKT
jgi:hypothetical protein